MSGLNPFFKPRGALRPTTSLQAEHRAAGDVLKTLTGPSQTLVGSCTRPEAIGWTSTLSHRKDAFVMGGQAWANRCTGRFRQVSYVYQEPTWLAGHLPTD